MRRTDEFSTLNWINEVERLRIHLRASPHKKSKPQAFALSATSAVSTLAIFPRMSNLLLTPLLLYFILNQCQCLNQSTHQSNLVLTFSRCVLLNQCLYPVMNNQLDSFMRLNHHSLQNHLPEPVASPYSESPCVVPFYLPSNLSESRLSFSACNTPHFS